MNSAGLEWRKLAKREYAKTGRLLKRVEKGPGERTKSTAEKAKQRSLRRRS